MPPEIASKAKMPKGLARGEEFRAAPVAPTSHQPKARLGEQPNAISRSAEPPLTLTIAFKLLTEGL